MPAIKKAEALEKMQHEPKTRQWYETELPKAVYDFYYSTYGIEGADQIAKSNQNSWVACCEYMRRQCITKDDLKQIKTHTLCNGGETYNESYDPQKVQMIADIYLHLCFTLDRLPSVYSFAVLTGIDREVMQVWIGSGKVSLEYSQNTPKKAVKSIAAARNEALQNLAATGGKSAIGSIAILNNTIWSENNKAPEIDYKKALTAETLPVFGLEDIPKLEDTAGSLPQLGNN